ncbi:hypothetical protein PE067_18540 [Paracoccus sp. DMF-8]|nr:hypothetical protein [Paracoccus sp. DMF-8]MDF3607953.1 hypothetical protein [Paracoccus sp. DMF-8]
MIPAARVPILLGGIIVVAGFRHGILLWAVRVLDQIAVVVIRHLRPKP